MAKDLIYYVDKKPKSIQDYPVAFEIKDFGEVQQTFNMSFTLDGTKDSVTYEVYSYSEKNAIEPYTIIYHQNTNTWWIVSNDKVTRHLNESGYLYIHELECLGAVELLNARDLTDCGFRSNKYIIGEFAERLISLSNIELPVEINYGDLDDTKSVDYIKTFENYTLLSALREFFNGYNYGMKLSFDKVKKGNKYYIVTININLISKTGNPQLETLNINDFDDVREVRKIDKNSFGSQVVTNAENVVSTKATTFPPVGSVRLSANEYTITSSNAILRLPAKVFKLNWLRMYTSGYFIISDGLNQEYVTVFPTNEKSIDNFIDEIKSFITAHYGGSAQSMIATLEEDIDEIKENTKKACSVTLYNGIDINPVTGDIVQTSAVPYIPTFVWNGGPERKLVIADKSLRDCLPLKTQGIYWERGSNEIKGFDILNGSSGGEIIQHYISSSNDLQGTHVYSQDTLSIDLRAFAVVDNDPIYLRYTLRTSSFAINYIPMSDLKIENQNDKDTKDIQLYNQSGKITDSVALSKLINSYAKEITSENIVKYYDYYDFDSIPSVGQLVYDEDSGENYVINNISIDFYQADQTNNSVNYKLECEISMSKQIAVKSLMVNANSNIRDYGIPQKDNVARKQVYKDICYFDFESNNENNYITPINNILSLQQTTTSTKDYTSIIKVTFSNNDNWYYQLPTTRYELNKQVIYELNFKDNNIIGYGSQNSYSAFQVSRIFDGLLTTINTPISYVDNNGELKSLNIVFCSNLQLTTLWNEYQDDSGYGSNTSYELYNFSVFIPSDIYVNAISEEEYDFKIDEPYYNKDALEVPVFEYSCQLINSYPVTVGEDIFYTYGEEWVFIYHYETSYGISVEINENNAMSFDNGSISLDGKGNPVTTYAVKLEYANDNEIKLGLYYTGGISGYVIKTDINTNYDLIVYRYAYNMKTGETRRSLMFIIRLSNDAYIDNNGDLHLYVNHKTID